MSSILLPFDQFESTAKILNLDMDILELSHLYEELGFSQDQMSAVSQVFEYLRDKKIRNTIDMYLRTSRLPREVPKTFDNFDFSVIKGRDAAKLKTLPSLSAIYAHRNLAFIGPAGL